MPENVECLNEIRNKMIEMVEGLGQEKFEKGGWFLTYTLPQEKVTIKFQVAGGPGSAPPRN